MRIPLPGAEDTMALGERIAALLRPGDLIILSGELGAGKTTFTRGLAAGLGVEGRVSSPTFIIARVHPGPLPLVHVDAYRLADPGEVDDLDLDSAFEDSVTVVEWGEGLVEDLSASRLEIRIVRPRGQEDAGRYAELEVIGPRWAGIDLTAAAAPA